MAWTWQVPWHLAPPLPYMWCHHRRQVKNLVILVIITILIISMIMMIVITIITMILTMMMFPQHAHCLCRPLHIWPPEELVPGRFSSPSLLPLSRSSSWRSWSSKPRWLPVLITSTPSCPRTRSRRGKWPTCGRWRKHHSCHHQGHEQTNPSKKPPLESSVQHEGYDSSIITNDVSVLKLDEPLEFNEWAFPQSCEMSIFYTDRYFLSKILPQILAIFFSWFLAIFSQSFYRDISPISLTFRISAFPIYIF